MPKAMSQMAVSIIALALTAFAQLAFQKKKSFVSNGAGANVRARGDKTTALFNKAASHLNVPNGPFNPQLPWRALSFVVCDGIAVARHGHDDRVGF
jgi:hypothetical protein